MLTSRWWIVGVFLAGVACLPMTRAAFRWLRGIRARRVGSSFARLRSKSSLETVGPSKPKDDTKDAELVDIAEFGPRMTEALKDISQLLREQREDRDQTHAMVERRSQEVLSALVSIASALKGIESAVASSRLEFTRHLGGVLEATAVPERIAIPPESRPTAVTTAKPCAGRSAPVAERPETWTAATGSLTDVIAASFCQIDLDTSRRFEDFRKRFLDLLGDRIVDIREEDGVVLFFESNTLAQAWPWPNNTLQKRWRDYFNAPKGENAPVRTVDRPAVLSFQSGGWTLASKGAIRQ